MKNNLSIFKNNLTVVILCGGKGQRLRPLTYELPKPLIKIKKKTILEYIINHFLRFKIKNIVIASGYKHSMLSSFIGQKYKSNNIKVISVTMLISVSNIMSPKRYFC